MVEWMRKEESGWKLEGDEWFGSIVLCCMV